MKPGAPRLALVIAPAGSGKSTLLAHVVEAVDHPVAWLSLDGGTNDVADFLRHLRAVLGTVLPALRPSWPTAETALADIENALTEPLLLVLDDLHGVEPRAVREVVGGFIDYQPELLHIVLSSRRTPNLDIVRQRLAGSVAEVDADALRFRTWEVDQLFRRYHQIHLRPQEVSALTRRTAGWAAGLQLFHLATHRRPPSTRTALLGREGPGFRLTQEYLTRHVLDRVEDDLRTFLVRTSVLDQLTARRCGALLGTSDAAEHLVELERNGLFTFADADGLVYRYHEVLRGYLLDELVTRFGAQEARNLHQRAGRLLEDEGALTEAIGSYCRAEDWDHIRRLLITGGASLAREPGAWIDLLPVSIRDRDPWALLALARRLLAEGSLDRAERMYRRAVDLGAPQGSVRTAAAELRMVQAWIRPTLGAVSDWVHLARSVLATPRAYVRRAPVPAGVTDALMLGYARLVCGEPGSAHNVFAGLVEDPELTVAAETAALLGSALSLTITGVGDTEDAGIVRERAAAAAKVLSLPAVTRLADGIQAVAGGDRTAVAYLLGECRRAEDRWSAALLQLLAELLALADGSASPELLEAVQHDFRDLAAPAPAAWAGAAAALAATIAGQPFPPSRLVAIEVDARAVGPLPYALALLAASPAMSANAWAPGGVEDRAIQVGERCGAGPLTRRIARRLSTAVRAVQTAPIPGRTPVLVPVSAPGGAVRIRCLGGFAIEVDGTPVDLGPVRPRYRELLRLLSLHANRPLHRELIIEWLWPSRHPERGHHSLQVAVSELRKLLEPTAPRGGWTRLCREDSVYRLVLDSDDDSDVHRLEHHLGLARAAVREADEEAAAHHLEAAIDTYAGELFPDDGPAEWVVAAREGLRNEVIEACERLAGLRAGHGRHPEAVQVLRYALAQDRYRDTSWQRLIASLRASGSPAAAAAATTAYRQVLAETGARRSLVDTAVRVAPP